MPEIDPSRLLLGDVVDIELFVGGRTRYDLVDVAGDGQSFELPNDLPFPVAIALEHAYDGVLAAAASADDDDAKAWHGLCAALAACASIVGPQIAPDDLYARFGRNAIMHWTNVVVTRLQMQQAGADLGTFLELLVKQPEDDADPLASPTPESSDALAG